MSANSCTLMVIFSIIIAHGSYGGSQYLDLITMRSTDVDAELLSLIDSRFAIRLLAIAAKTTSTFNGSNEDQIICIG